MTVYFRAYLFKKTNIVCLSHLSSCFAHLREFEAKCRALINKVMSEERTSAATTDNTEQRRIDSEVERLLNEMEQERHALETEFARVLPARLRLRALLSGPTSNDQSPQQQQQQQQQATIDTATLSSDGQSITPSQTSPSSSASSSASPLTPPENVQPVIPAEPSNSKSPASGTDPKSASSATSPDNPASTPSPPAGPNNQLATTAAPTKVETVLRADIKEGVAGTPPAAQRQLDHEHQVRVRSISNASDATTTPTAGAARQQRKPSFLSQLLHRKPSNPREVRLSIEPEPAAPHTDVAEHGVTPIDCAEVPNIPSFSLVRCHPLCCFVTLL